MLRVSRIQRWIRGLVMASVAALGVAAFGPPAWAGDIVNFDPSGGATPNSALNVSSFAWLPGNSLAINGGGPLTPGQNVSLVYQAILGSINTSVGNSASLASNNGNISTTNGGNTNMQIVIEARFTETVQSFTNNGTTTIANFSFNPAGPNLVSIFAQASNAANSANVNDGTGLGFTGAAPARTTILTGTVNGNGFTSSFNADNASFTSPVALDQHAGGNSPLGSINTITGSGNTSLQVTVTSQSNAYFLTSPLSVLNLNFNTISSGVPFRAVEPEGVMFTGNVNSSSASSLGTINGLNGANFLLQSQANNDFTLSAAVPEPGTMAMALTGIGLSALSALRTLRRRKASLTA